MLFVVVLLLLCVQNIAGAITINQVVPVASTTSQTTISILGGGFTSVGTVTIHISGILCSNPIKESASVITCLAEPGLGSANELLLTWAEGNHSANVVDFVAASNVGACTGLTNLVVSDATAAVPVTICGANFGESYLTTDSAAWSGTLTVSVPTLGVDNVGVILSHHDDQLICTFPDLKGVGQFLPVAVTLGGQSVIVDGFTISFPPPIVGAAVVEDLTQRRLTGKKIMISGSGFGTPGPNVKIVINVGPFACAPVTHTSDSEVSCIVMGEGSNYEIEVIVNGQSSLVRDVAYSTFPSVRVDFLDTAMPGNSICTPPFGTPDLFNPEYCNCWSGYAPSNNLHNDCDVHPACPAKVLSLSVVSPFAPNRPKFEFRDDKLFVVQTVPIVKGRRDTTIQFAAPHFQNPAEASPQKDAGVIGSPQCSYPGILWEKHITTLDCVEEYSAVLPWSQQQFCGFIEHTSASILASGKREYKANLVTTYFETFTKKNGKLAMRKMSTAYLVKVSFARRVTLFTSKLSTFIADEQSASSLNVEVSSDLLYDVETKNTIITFTTSAVWPYKLDADLQGTWQTATSEPLPVSVDINLATPQPGELVCAQVADTVCEQSWIMILDNPDVCNLRGVVNIESNDLKCRDFDPVDDCPGAQQLNFKIHIGDTDLCATTTPSADASKDLSATLDSYYTEDHSINQNIFQLGDTVYFRLAVRDPTTTIDSITFNKIWIFRGTNTASQDVLYEVATPGDLPHQATINLVDAKFNITHDQRDSLLAPGDESILTFSFRLDRLYLPNTVQAVVNDPADTAKQLGVEAIIDIAYHGNSKKRTITTSTGNFPMSAHHYISFYAEEMEEDLATNDFDYNTEEEAGWTYNGELLFGSSASSVPALPLLTLVIVFISSFVVLA